ncbi:MAG: type III PLP-dependent enzyme [Gammaproteobacteria bacterium]
MNLPPAETAGPVDTRSPAEMLQLVATHGSPLFVIDCTVLRQQFRRLQAALPGVDLHYALKPLPVAAVVRTLLAEGAWFDLATAGEVELVGREGVPSARCIHTHPIKRPADIVAALAAGVTDFVADNADEIAKFASHPSARLLLRVAFRNPEAKCDLSRKFGCEPEDVPALLDMARAQGTAVIGLSFHVGSQAASPAMHVLAIESCTRLLLAAAAAGHELTTLDIGGGFPVEYHEGAMAIETFCAPIRAALAGLPSGVRVIAEPGRFIAAPAGFVLTSVMGRARRDGQWWYYLDDGLYGSFSGQLFDHAVYPVEPLTVGGIAANPAQPREPAVLAGPTCDSIDVVAETLPLPELHAGDVLLGRMMGAYTAASATDFNFFPRARILAVNLPG